MNAIKALRMAERDAKAKAAAIRQYRKAARMHHEAGYQLLRQQMDDWAEEVFSYAAFLEAEVTYMVERP